MGFFEGASANASFGAGLFLCIGFSHYFHVKMGCGKGSTTHAEFLDLWGVSYTSHRMGYPLSICIEIL